MRRFLAFIAIALGLGSAIAYAQIINPSGGGGGTPGGSNTQLQFNTNSTFGGISGVTSDSANVGFATNSQLFLYGTTVGDCLKVGASNQIADFGAGCGGSGSPGGLNTQVQFNTAGSFGGVSGATSNGSNISFTTNSLVINGQAISKVSGNTGTVATIIGALVSGHCVQLDANSNLVDSGTATCGGITASNTNIAAGTNITTSGTTANVTVNVVATPSFTTVIASGNITAGTAQFTGQLTGTSAVFQTATVSNLTPTGPNCLQETGGVLQATNTGCATQTATPSIAAGTNITTSGTAANTTINVVATPSFTTVIASGNITAGTAQFTGLLTGTNAVFQTLTVSNLTPTGPNCLQETGGILQATNTGCATQVATPSIAAGANITTSGTPGNVSIAVVPTTPEFGVQYNHAGVMTADSGFTIFSGISTHTLAGNITTTNSHAVSIIGTLSSSIVQFGAPLFMNITTNAFAAGTKLVDVQASGISYLSVFASTGMTALGNITGTTAQITGWLTAPGVNMQTATLAGALIGTSGNFSTNLTGNIAQFAGFLSAGGASLSGLTIQTETLSGALIGTSGNFSTNLTANIAQFAGFLSAGGASISGVSLQTATFSQITGTSAFVTSVIGNAGTNSEGSISFLTNNVVQFGDGGLNANGYYNWGGEARLSADSAGLITTGFGNLLTVNVKAGRTYKFDAELPLRSATASTGGIGLRIGGGATATAIVYDGWVVDSGFNGTKGNSQATALSTTVASTSITGTTSHATLIGTITVNAAGTIILQASGFSTVTAASAITVGRGATFIVEDMP